MSKQTFGSFLPVVSSQKKNKDYHRLGDSIVVWNKKRESVKDIAKPEEYNHVCLRYRYPLSSYRPGYYWESARFGLGPH